MKTTTAALALLIGSMAQAQTVRISPEPFPIGATQLELPISPMAPATPVAPVIADGPNSTAQAPAAVPSQSKATTLGPLAQASQTEAQVSSPQSAAVIAQTPEPAKSKLEVAAGERLSVAMRAWLQTHGMQLSWEASGSQPGRMRDVVFERDWKASDSDLVQTLSQVLAPFALNAQIVQSSKTVVIRNQSPATNSAQASSRVQ